MLRECARDGIESDSCNVGLSAMCCGYKPIHSLKNRLDAVRFGSFTTHKRMPERREMTEQTRWQAKQPSQVTCFSKDLRC